MGFLPKSLQVYLEGGSLKLTDQSKRVEGKLESLSPNTVFRLVSAGIENVSQIGFDDNAGKFYNKDNKQYVDLANSQITPIQSLIETYSQES